MSSQLLSLAAAGHAEDVADSGYTAVSDVRDYVQSIAGSIRANKSDYWARLSHPYYYNTDGDEYYVSDGGNDIYDGGNYTEVFVGDDAGNGYANSDCLIAYSNISATDINNNNTHGSGTGYGAYTYACGGYQTSSSNSATSTSMPLFVVASAGNTTDSFQTKIGLSKSGNSGADGSSSSTKEKRILYNGTTVNGFTVYAADVTIHGTHGDPSTVDLYVALLHSNWNSTTGGASLTVEAPSAGFGTGNTGSCDSQFYFDSATQNNIVFIAMLFSEYNSGGTPNSPQPTTTELQNIIGDMTLDIKNDLGL